MTRASFTGLHPCRTSGLHALLVFISCALCSCADGTPASDNAARGTEAGGESTDGDGMIALENGSGIYYRRVGNGSEAVILTPGLFMHPGLADLADGRTLIFLDPRNRGRSDAEADSTLLTIEQEVHDLEAVRRHFGFETVALVGYSYAGLLVALYALEYPHRVSRLVQLGPVPRRFGTEYPAEWTAPEPPEAAAPAAELEQLRASGADRSRPREFCEKSWEVSRLRLVGNPADAARLGSSHCVLPNEWPSHLVRQFRFHFASVQRLDLSAERVASIQVPVLTIHGTLDRNAPYGAGREWAATLPNARLLTIAGAAHQSWADYPHVVLPAINQFLRGEWPAAAQNVRAH